MAYDPASDPRWLPDTPEATAVDDDRRLELELALQIQQELLEMFDAPGWEHVTRMVERDKEAADMALRREFDQGQWMLVRGQARIYDWILELKETIQTQNTQTIAKMRQLMGEE